MSFQYHLALSFLTGPTPWHILVQWKKFSCRAQLSQQGSCENSSCSKGGCPSSVHKALGSPKPAAESYPWKTAVENPSVCHRDASPYIKDAALPGQPVAERQSSSFERLGEGKFNFPQEKMSPPPLLSIELEWNLATSSHKVAAERERHDLWPKSQHFFTRGFI